MRFYLAAIFPFMSCATPKLTVKLPESPPVASRASAVRSISLGDTDYQDLATFGAFVGDADAVMLGESHGDGTSQVAMSRLVRFLHEKLGFDVVAFEAGLLDAQGVDAALTQGDAVAASIASIPAPWSESEQSRPLFEYIKSTKSTAHPLKIAGFDTVVRDDAESLKRITALLTRADVSVTGEQSQCLKDLMAPRPKLTCAPLLALLEKQLKDSTQGTDLERETAFRFLEGLRAMISTAEFINGAPDPKTRREEHIAYMKSVSPKLIFRDVEMGKNITWLMERPFRGSKVIFWGAGSHLASCSAMEGGTSVSAGEALFRQRGAKARSVEFTWYDGMFGTPWYEIGPVDPVSADSLEGVLHRTGHPFWFVDVRGATEPIFKGKDRCHQGVFFIDRMEAIRRAPLQKK
jgi:erythromycin esterase